MESNEVVAAPAGPGRVIVGLIKTMRPRQWVENAFVFAALVFDRKILQPGPLAATRAGVCALFLRSPSAELCN